MSISAINIIPTPPSRNDSPADFVLKANNFLGALKNFNAELNVLVNNWNTEIAQFNNDNLTTSGRLSVSENAQDGISQRMQSVEAQFALSLPSLDLAAADQLITELVQSQLETMSRYWALKTTTETQAEQIRILTNSVNILSKNVLNKEFI